MNRTQLRRMTGIVYSLQALIIALSLGYYAHLHNSITMFSYFPSIDPDIFRLSKYGCLILSCKEADFTTYSLLYSCLFLINIIAIIPYMLFVRDLNKGNVDKPSYMLYYVLILPFALLIFLFRKICLGEKLRLDLVFPKQKNLLGRYIIFFIFAFLYPIYAHQASIEINNLIKIFMVFIQLQMVFELIALAIQTFSSYKRMEIRR